MLASTSIIVCADFGQFLGLVFVELTGGLRRQLLRHSGCRPPHGVRIRNCLGKQFVKALILALAHHTPLPSSSFSVLSVLSPLLQPHDHVGSSSSAVSS